MHTIPLPWQHNGSFRCGHAMLNPANGLLMAVDPLAAKSAAFRFVASHANFKAFHSFPGVLKSKKNAYLPLGKHSWAGKSQFHVCRRVKWHCCHLICSVALHRQIGYVDLCSQYMTKLRCSSWCGTVCHVKETT